MSVSNSMFDIHRKCHKRRKWTKLHGKSRRENVEQSSTNVIIAMNVMGFQRVSHSTHTYLHTYSHTYTNRHRKPQTFKLQTQIIWNPKPKPKPTAWLSLRSDCNSISQARTFMSDRILTCEFPSSLLNSTMGAGKRHRNARAAMAGCEFSLLTSHTCFPPIIRTNHS